MRSVAVCLCLWTVFAVSLFHSISISAQLIDPPGPPTVELIVPEPGEKVHELISIEIKFDRKVLGVQAEDLLINGLPATNVNEVVEGQFVFTFQQPEAGNVIVTWKTDHGITDVNGLSFAGGSFNYVLDLSPPPPPIMISEFMANNDRTLRDSDGDTSDWIELFNPTDAAVSLEGWALTDVATNKTEWRFPAVSIAAKGFLVVFASEKNRTNPAAQLHTNFKLSDKGEYLGLIAPDGTVVSEFAPAFPPQFVDISYGRVLTSPGTVGYFTKPTPGATNVTSGPGFAPEVSFSQTSALYTNGFLLTLSVPNTNAVIRYTMNGAMPTNNSLLYTQAITITNSIQIRARSFQDSLLPGPVHSEIFTRMSNNLVNFTSTLPVLVIDTLGRLPSSSAQTFANISLFEQVNGSTKLTNAPTIIARGAVKIRGSSTEGIAKASFAMEFWDELAFDMDRSLLGLPEDSDWVLYAPNSFEPIMIHNPFIHQLSRDGGMYSPRTRFVEVFLRTSTGGLLASNTYNGIYVLEEKIKIGKHRVDIDKLQPQHLKPPEVTGGYLMKIDRLDPGDSGFSAAGATGAYIDPKEAEIRVPARLPQRAYLSNYFAAFGKALNSTNYKNPDLGYANYIDVDSWINFHILETISGNVDTLVLSTYFHKPRNGKITFGPHWDFDRALGSTDGRDSSPRSWTTGNFFSATWWNRLFTDPDFWQKWVDRYQTMRHSLYATTNMNRLIDDLSGQLREAQPRETKRWGTAFRGGTYQTEINFMKNWVSNRLDFFDRQMTPSPVIGLNSQKVEPGFNFEIKSAATNVVFYTLDGTDPRLPGGNVNPRALSNAGPFSITVTTNVRVFARARNPLIRQSGGPPITTPWSAPSVITLYTALPRIVPTEIMYHPADAPSGSTNSASDFEFVELKNADSTEIDLTGFVLTNAVSYVFTTNSAITKLQPGERLVLVKNKAAIQARYPNVKNIAGEYQGSFSNGNNHLALLGLAKEPIFDFEFSDDWYKMTDGFGFSLVLKEQFADAGFLQSSTLWRASAFVGGSPGEPDPAPASLSPILVNEVLSNPNAGGLDSVELYNPTSQDVDISGWFLSDAFRTPKKYVFPLGSRIQAGGYLVVTEQQFRTGPNSFSLSSNGDDVYLYSGDASGNLTGYYHGFSFGDSAQGQSFGRVVTSDGKEHLVAQAQSTLGKLNVAPAVGPIVFSEIMFAPTSTNAYEEYLELRNISAASVNLFDPAHTTNTWHIRGDVEYDFPSGAAIPPGGLAVVVGFDPQDLGRLNAFKSRYGFAAQSAVYGPWNGRLDNAGGKVRLNRPGIPEPVSKVQPDYIPEILVEEVDYSAKPPWPAQAGGSGLSLNRVNITGFGSEPQNWAAAWPNPGDFDSDGDGLSDAWEIANGTDPLSADDKDGPLGDINGDGKSNIEEFVPAFAKKVVNSFVQLKVSRPSDGEVELTYIPVKGRSYTLSTSDDLSTNKWTVIKSFGPAQDTNSVSMRHRPDKGTLFYRLQTP